jgi:signal transduction histidine kinase
LLLNKNSTDLGNFITTNPKGKIIPGYLSSLSERLTAEQQDLLREIELLTKNIEHIKEIVAMQQNYARVSGIIESLSLRNLVEDALQMNAAALSRHGILVVREYEEVPVIAVDKHKILQILVNLIRNAKYAIDAAAKRDGHGFGLHSGALAAREMGGSLTAHSSGPGEGATFILELPLSAPKSMEMKTVTRA